MESSLIKVLEKGIAEIDESLLGGNTCKNLMRLYDEITLFNPMYGLVNASGEDLVVRHILDCLAPYSMMKSETSVRMADLGSGSGLPGLVLASAFPEREFFLVERMGRRAGFLRNTIAVLGMNGRVNVIQKDLSEVRDMFDMVTFRAFRQLKDIISDLDRILVKGGRVFSYKSSEENIREELEVLESYKGYVFSHDIVEYKVPMLNATRRMFILAKS